MPGLHIIVIFGNCMSEWLCLGEQLGQFAANVQQPYIDLQTICSIKIILQKLIKELVILFSSNLNQILHLVFR